MRFLLLLAVIVMIIAFGFKYFYKGVKPLTPAPATPLPPAISRPPTPILSPAETAKVIESTKDTNPNVRWQALKFLVQTNAPEADIFLPEMLRGDPDVVLRKNIVLMLGEHPGPKTPE